MIFSHADILSQILLPLGISDFQVTAVFRGGNNRSCLVKTSGRDFFLKIYVQEAASVFGRGRNEYRWIEALWFSGCRDIPEPIKYIESDQYCAGLYEYLPGSGFAKPEVTANDIEFALNFLVNINRFSENPAVQSLPEASEACFSKLSHFHLISKRIQRLSKIDQEGSHAGLLASEFVRTQLIPTWNKISKVYLASPDWELDRKFQILSPSDFGFHNSIISSDGRSLRFIDFEYAGWDDPAKLVCDFFNQVAVPVPRIYLAGFVQRVESIVNESVLERVQSLLPLYQLKWVCIILNHFLPTMQERKKFAFKPDENWENQLQIQLEKARLKLDEIDLI